MATFPAKTNYAAGNVLTAAQMVDIGEQINALNGCVGKNKIINGAFDWNQRSFSSSTSSGSYTFDRWNMLAEGGGTVTTTAQTFTAGTAPVSGYEAKNFIRQQTTGQTATNVASWIAQKIESARTLAGQTATISFWAKAASGTPKISVVSRHNYGSGGSPTGTTDTYLGQVTLTTSWARYSITTTILSASGKTFGTTTDGFLEIQLWTSAGSDFNARTNSLGIQTNTFDIWGVQVEAGNTATAFQTATGTLQGELAACQRYYWRSSNAQIYGAHGLGFGSASTTATIYIKNPVTMRIKPTSIDYSTLILNDSITNTAITGLVMINDFGTSDVLALQATVASGLTTNRPYILLNNNSTAGYIGFSAEL